MSLHTPVHSWRSCSAENHELEKPACFCAQPSSLNITATGTPLTHEGGSELPVVSYRAAGAWMFLPFSFSILYSTPSMMTLDCMLILGTCFTTSFSSASSSNRRVRFCCSFRAAKIRQTHLTPQNTPWAPTQGCNLLGRSLSSSSIQVCDVLSPYALLGCLCFSCTPLMLQMQKTLHHSLSVPPSLFTKLPFLDALQNRLQQFIMLTACILKLEVVCSLQQVFCP